MLKVNFTFFENANVVKDYVPIENMSLLLYAVEWAYSYINF